MLLDRLGPPGRGSGWRPHGGEGAGGDALSYGVSFATTRSHQLAEGGSGVLSLRHFGLVLFIPWRVGAEEAGAANFGSMASAGALTFFVTPIRARARFSLILSAGAMLLDRLGPPGRCSCWPHDGEVAGGAVADFGLSDFRFEAAA